VSANATGDIVPVKSYTAKHALDSPFVDQKEVTSPLIIIIVRSQDKSFLSHAVSNIILKAYLEGQSVFTSHTESYAEMFISYRKIQGNLHTRPIAKEKLAGSFLVRANVPPILCLDSVAGVLMFEDDLFELDWKPSS
jgi:hypothetical protein